MGNSISKLEQVEALKNGSGMQRLIDEAYKILGNPLLMYDMDYRLLAHTESIITDDPLWNEIIVTGSYSSETIEFFKDEYFIDAVANADTITFLTSDKLKFDRFSGKIFNRDNIIVANVHIVSSLRPFEEGDPLAFEAVCKKLSEETARVDFYQSYGTEYQETMIKMLIDGSISDRRVYSSHAASIYRGLKNNLYLAVVDITRSDPEHTRLAYFRDLFKQTQPAFKYYIYSVYIVIIISSDDEAHNIRKYLSKFAGLFDQNNMYAGISGCFKNLFELRKYYLEAIGALDIGLKNYSAQRIFLYHEII